MMLMQGPRKMRCLNPHTHTKENTRVTYCLKKTSLTQKKRVIAYLRDLDCTGDCDVPSVVRAPKYCVAFHIRSARSLLHSVSERLRP